MALAFLCHLLVCDDTFFLNIIFLLRSIDPFSRDFQNLLARQNTAGSFYCNRRMEETRAS